MRKEACTQIVGDLHAEVTAHPARSEKGKAVVSGTELLLFERARFRTFSRIHEIRQILRQGSVSLNSCSGPSL